MSWTGSCTNCGLCCTLTVSGERFRCENLTGPLGDTRCGVYTTRYMGMPIKLTSATGHTIHDTCQPIFPLNRTNPDAVPPECGYRWEDHAEQADT